jgi:hypothetical protein
MAVSAIHRTVLAGQRIAGLAVIEGADFVGILPAVAGMAGLAGQL